MSHLGHRTIIAGVNVQSINSVSAIHLEKCSAVAGSYLPVRIVIHGHHVALLDYTMLLRQLGLRKGLPLLSARP